MDDQAQLNQNFKPNEVQEESSENINTEENVMTYNPPSSATPPKETYEKKNNTDSSKNSIWYDLSIISWFLLLSTELNLIISLISSFNVGSITVIPIYENLNLVVGFISMISTIGFILYFKNTTLKNNNNLLNAMLGDMSKFHCVPLFLVSFLMISLAEPTTKASYVFSLIFSVLALGSLVFLYLKIDYEGEWYEILTIKKGVFSCLIAFTLYTFCLSITLIGCRSQPSEGFLNGCGIVFSILIGLGSNGFGFFFKDLLVLITNILIYVEMAKNSFYMERGAEGGIQITMIVISMGTIFYLFFKERENIYKC